MEFFHAGAEQVCFDDVLLYPQYSDIASRSEVDLSVDFCGTKLTVPIISANMDTITEAKMARAMYYAGGAGILHRYTDPDTMLNWIKDLDEGGILAVPSIGIKPEDYDKAMMYASLQDIKAICIDVAHGHSKAVIDMIKKIRNDFDYIIAGNVATREGFIDLVEAGANIIKVGVGPGSVCTTRIVTGHGVPQLSAVMECAKVRDNWSEGSKKVQIIADGGIRRSDDAVKCLGAGADLIMIGGMLAGTDETPLINGQHTMRGMSSRDAQIEFKGRVGNGVAEGVAYKPLAKGPVKSVIDELAGGIRSGLSYSGSCNLTEFKKNAKFIRVTSNCVNENHPHGLKISS